MKVVLFCGGQGMRIRDAEDLPKPMVHIGYRPILWHVMKYYAHFGHKDFILCLGHRADAIKNYFLNYNECASNDFILSGGAKNLELLHSDIHDWRITFADTGHQVQYRPAAESGGEVSRRRRRISGQLQRRPHRPAAAAAARSFSSAGQDRQLCLCPAEPQLSPGFGGSRAMAAWFQGFMPSTTAACESMADFLSSRKKSSSTCATRRNWSSSPSIDWWRKSN